MLAVVGVVSGCSLVSLHTPGKPLPPRELNARFLTREYADSFQATVARAADEITANSTDATVQVAALQWKIRASIAGRHAATQLAPLLALLDCWALSAQMREFLSDGAGAALFGTNQDIARTAAARLESDVVVIAHKVTTQQEFARYRKFVADYVRDEPLMSAEFVRASVVDRWSAQQPAKVALVSTVGSVPEVISDFADRLRLYGDQVPSEALWQAQLSLRQTSGEVGGWRVEASRMNDSLGDIGRFATASPQLLHDSVGELRSALASTAARMDRSGMQMIRLLGDERAALAENVRYERESIVESVDQQRAAITRDAARIAYEVTESSWHQLRALVRELMLYWIAVLLFVLGLPFAAGYYLGRAATRRTP